MIISNQIEQFIDSVSLKIFAMKKMILLSFCAFLFTTTLQAQEFVFQDFGDGLVFSLNEQVSLDLNENDDIDFEVNNYADELGFYPFSGCFHSVEGFDPEIGGTRIIIVEEGDVIENGMYFEDYDKNPLYYDNQEPLPDWNDNEFKYAAIFYWTDWTYAWVKLKVDLDNKTIVIKSVGYSTVPSQSIIVGQQEATSTNIEEVISDELSAFPNPVNDELQLSFQLLESTDVVFSCYASNGQRIFKESRALSAGQQMESFDLAHVNNGQYQLVINAGNQVINKNIIVSK